MMTLSLYPQNKDKVVKLIDFLARVLDVCKEIDVYPILDGGMAVFLYTQNPKIIVNDIDLSCSEKYFKKILKALVNKGFKAEIKEWHVLQIREDDLKIEFGDMDFWYPGVPVEVGKYIKIRGHKLGILRLDSLISFYRIGIKNLEKEKEQKQAKYNALKAKYELLIRAGKTRGVTNPENENLQRT
jgi:hypothetical protein